MFGNTALAVNGRSFFAKCTDVTRSAIDTAKSKWGQAATVVGGMAAAGMAAAQGTPGSAIASELSTGKADVMLVIAAAAIIIGVLVLWSYVKRAR